MTSTLHDAWCFFDAMKEGDSVAGLTNNQTVRGADAGTMGAGERRAAHLAGAGEVLWAGQDKQLHGL